MSLVMIFHTISYSDGRPSSQCYTDEKTLFMPRWRGKPKTYDGKNHQTVIKKQLPYVGQALETLVHHWANAEQEIKSGGGNLKSIRTTVSQLSLLLSAVRPCNTTLTQHYTNIWSMSRDCWVLLTWTVRSYCHLALHYIWVFLEPP